MKSRSVSAVVVEAVARVLRSRGFEQKGRKFVRRELPAYLVVEVQVDRLRGMTLVLTLMSDVQSRDRGWPINDPFKEGIEYCHSGPAFLDPKEFQDWEIVEDLAAAEQLGDRWAHWLETRGMEFLRQQADEIIERDRS